MKISVRFDFFQLLEEMATSEVPIREAREQTKALRKAYSNKSVVFPFSVGDVVLAEMMIDVGLCCDFGNLSLGPLHGFFHKQQYTR